MNHADNLSKPATTPDPQSRRHALKAMLLPAVGVPIAGGISPDAAATLLSPATVWQEAAGSKKATPQHVPLNRFPRMVQEFYVQQVRDAEHKNLAALDALATKGDAEAYVRLVRDRIQESFGPFPERTPLNARVTGTTERDGYRIENVIFESRPGFPVTANLYVPTNREGRMPGVVG
ncbi:MAG: hypothetical protein KDB01_24275, partial [Planctomycetaceae bacterium]|nr:hypothetical protein [Planctomycetaceae bacterium]